MRLRARLALSVLAAALPLAAASVWLRADLERRNEEDVLREFAVTRMETGGREECERDPARYPPPRRRGGRGGQGGRPGAAPPPPPPEIPLVRRPRLRAGPEGTRFWTYNGDFTSANPRSPEIAPALSAALGPEGDVASRRVKLGDREVREALVRMSWTGTPCDFVLVRRDSPPDSLLSHLLTGGLIGGGVLIAVLLAMGPAVRRIRRLEAGVRASAADRYRTSVEVDGKDEITDLAAAFNEAGERVRAHVGSIEEREETLRTFVANTTHDLMTPLTVLQGHLDRLGRDDSGQDPEAESRARRDAMREVDYTTSLVSNLSTAAKLEANTGSFSHSVNLVDVVERVAGRFGPVARAAGVELNHSVPAEAVWTRGDDTLIEQAVGNVVQNGIRYNRAGGHVALLLRMHDPDRFSILVVDDGPGIAADELVRLTERGYRGDEARTRNPRGRGLGLDIARGVAGRHGFDLRFGQPDGGGLEVTFEGSRRA